MGDRFNKVSIGDRLLYQAVFVLAPVEKTRANSAHIRQRRPASGLGFQVKVLEAF